ncbi:MAG: carbohydrate-binding family 9-like protein, partial [Kiloniellaceae bacterium]
ATRAAGPLTIDGRLDEAAWADAPPANLSGHTGRPAASPTTVRVLYDDEYLYVGFVCHEAQLAALVGNTTAHDGDIWRDDCVEVFLDPGGPSYYHFLVNCRGVTGEEATTGGERDVAWTAAWTAATTVDEAAAVDIVLAPGEASLHHGWVMHASHPNTTDDRRIALTMRYVAPSVRQTLTDKESATLVRGADPYGHFRPEPAFAGEFAPEAVAFQAAAERLKHEVYDSA